MDDECAEVLGKPISSMKVTDLRDELAKRGLVKTGNKKELVDRLRNHIVNRSDQSGAADLSLKQTSTHATEHNQDNTESPIEHSSNLTQSRDELINQSDNNATGAQNSPDQETVHQDVASREEEDPNQARDPEENQSGQEENQSGQEEPSVVTSQGEDNTVDPPHIDPPTQMTSQEEISIEKAAAEPEITQEASPIELEDSSTTKNQESCPKVSDTDMNCAEESNGQTDQDTAENTERVSHAPEPATPITFTLKRGFSDVKDSVDPNKGEKRRKWSNRSDSGLSEGATSQAASITGGISSQKLQELIDIKQIEQSKKESKKDSSKKPETTRDVSKAADKVASKKDGPETTTDEKQGSGSSDDKDPEAAAEDTPAPPAAAEEKSKQADPVKDPTNGLLIMHLVRPFTVSQLKEELTKFGPINEEKFWTNKVKSKCCVLYESIDAARQTKELLHGQHWPSSNPKTLRVSYISEEEYENIITFDELKKSESKTGFSVNGSGDQSNKTTKDRAEHIIDAEAVVVPLQKRLGDKVPSNETSSKSNIVRDGDRMQTQELDDLFKKTKSKPPLFWLPLSEEQAEIRQVERKKRGVGGRDSNRKAPARRSPAARRRSSPIRRSPPRHRSPHRSQARHRSPVGRRSPPRRRSPARVSPPPRRRSPRDVRRSPESPRRMLAPRESPIDSRRSPHLLRRSPVPIRRSPSFNRRSPGPIRRSPVLLRRSPGPVRRSPGPIRRSPGPIRRSPGPVRRSSPPTRRSPGPMRRSPGPLRRSPGPMRRSPGPMRRSPGPMRRSPGPLRRSPVRLSPGLAIRSPDMNRRSPGLGRRSPGPLRRSPIFNRRSPGPIRRSPGLVRRSPGPIRRSPGPIRRSPEPIRRSPRPLRRSPGPIRRSPGPIRRSPEQVRRSPRPMRRSPGMIRRSPGPMRRSPGPIRRDRFDRR